MPHQGLLPPVRPGAGYRAHKNSQRPGWNIRKATLQELQTSSEATVRAGMRTGGQILQQSLLIGHHGAAVMDEGFSSEDSRDGDSSNEEPSSESEDEGNALMNAYHYASTANGIAQCYCWICDHPYEILRMLSAHISAPTTHCCIIEDFKPSKEADQVYVVVSLGDGTLRAWPRRAFYGANGVHAAALQWDINGSRALIQEIQPSHFLIFTQKQSKAFHRAQHSTMSLEELPEVLAPFALHGARIPALPEPAPIDGLIVTQSPWKGLDRLKAPSAVKVRSKKALLLEMCPKTVSNLQEQLRYNRSVEKAGQEVDERLRPFDDNKGEDQVDDEGDAGNGGHV
ncbi:hypothetical protein KC332_g1317 [Hortaea werneckii]|nr:hypothetical protein KC358_g662 [Hortaea werneckii]KAI6852661.1 hypothetical protein KC350_g698 [Hortaea werneckii]KAI6943786.1 hypothetical protein KC341_g1263 [Hortaea werneckii]KAI6950422.1 hypothetical protein KC348_g693 [Hortaea werneckii]KAI6982598.1 hypothetical protein KC321_g554 [Hortaea werneckii]